MSETKLFIVTTSVFSVGKANTDFQWVISGGHKSTNNICISTKRDYVYVKLGRSEPNPSVDVMLLWQPK